MGKSLVWIGLIGLCALPAWGQEVPADELQVNLNGYFDNFRVTVVYPTVSLTKQVRETTSLTGRYLVDVISAASMKSRFDVDGVTSATSRRHGGGEGGLDEVRHEVGLGVTQLLSKATVSVNGIYSTEHDYTSRTLAAQLAYPFARQNTTLRLGIVRSWDQVFPQTRSWTEDKRIFTLSGGLTQVLGKRLIAQLDVSYAENTGLLSDPYQVVTILQGEAVSTFEPVHPDRRRRKAAGLRANYRLTPRWVLHLGYRYYWDDWDVRSHTMSTRFQHRFPADIRVSLGTRTYLQSKAFFFEADYSAPVPLMAVDSKLDQGYSAELQVNAVFGPSSLGRVPLLKLFANEKVELNLSFNAYLRHTASPDWHSRFRNLYAYIVSIGYRYRF